MSNPRGRSAAVGNLVFEQRRGNPVISGGMAVVGAGLTLYGLYYLATTVSDQENGMDGRSVLVIPGGLMLLFGLWAFVNRIRLYDQGVEQRSFFGTRLLRYEDIQTLGYAATRILVAGIETGTRIWVTLRPARGRGVVFDLTVRDRSEPFERLRDHVADLIGTRMVRDIQRGEVVAWGSSAKLAPKGLVYRPSRLIGRGSETLVSYSQDVRWSFAEGHLVLFEGEKVLTTLECRGANFFPGLTALSRLVGARGDRS